MSVKKLTEAYTLFDKANTQDPNTEDVNGSLIPKELIYGQRMTQTLETFDPEASDALKLAARSQHICRWEIPRSNYVMDRTGYLKWREDLKKFHAKKASEILQHIGYDIETINRVSFLLQKKKLKKDEETQTLEDVICLVFLNFYYEDFLIKHTEEKVIDILQKTWRKMSEKGHKAALQLLYSEKALDLIKQAING
ncbi:hypothetical protein IWQ47_004087 [Aquimarina sp. EL_43]|uniref:DUF4202 domain-containing protein n=1 Tax=Aquimarina TaxID=290174 RepID=UPI00046F5D2C|nr:MULTISPECIES: DUF4202 domain-containing protein [Aquimarina]MBG6132196.1 hypothetical protein [Aquimarina sp. EL_35]MBG6152993.1 hypothetical protein [Aquimarina sp. EL_32]MBG6171000.1 hypothetical protein [Aquimarina sp. EL_43]